MSQQLERLPGLHVGLEDCRTNSPPKQRLWGPKDCGLKTSAPASQEQTGGGRCSSQVSGGDTDFLATEVGGKVLSRSSFKKRHCDQR